ncbi:hypothetical protein FB451DRAFT_418452 [Mycena latifolia]|nr:hypothetical protein FB451DRAFT_418452 [Mycena latifolia]
MHCHPLMLSSPFTSKLGTNYCPQDEEVAQIQTLLAEPTQRLKRLDDEIRDLQKALDQLMEERGRLGEYVDAHRALISPVRRLPLDIIQEIFIACLPTHRNCVMTATEAPILLGRICGSWRSMSLSTPRLWARLHIVVPSEQRQQNYGIAPCNSNSEEKALRRLETARMWLGRSGECAVSISVQGPKNPVLTASTTPGLFLQALIPFASRWERINLTLSPLDLAQLSNLTMADVPRLKSFTIQGVDQFPDNNTIQVDWLGFLRRSELSSISLSGITFSPLDIPLRGNSLTDLSILPAWQPEGSLITSEVVLQLLSRFPMLQTCRLDINDPPGTAHGEVLSHIECAFLHTLDLRISGVFLVTASQLFGRLSFPELRHLQLSAYSYEDHMTQTPSFFAAAPRVESLDLHLLFSKSSLADFFRSLSPTIRKLRLIQSYVSDLDFLDVDPLSMLIQSPDLHIACLSNVEEIEIIGTRSCSDEALLQFIRSRMAARTFGALKCIKIQFCRSNVAATPKVESRLGKSTPGAVRLDSTRLRPDQW